MFEAEEHPCLTASVSPVKLEVRLHGGREDEGGKPRQERTGKGLTQRAGWRQSWGPWMVVVLRWRGLGLLCHPFLPVALGKGQNPWIEAPSRDGGFET